MGAKKKTKKELEAEAQQKEEENRRLEEEAKRKQEEDKRIKEQELQQRQLEEQQRQKDELIQIQQEHEEFGQKQKSMQAKIDRFYSNSIRDRTRNIQVSPSSNPFPEDAAPHQKTVWLPFPLDNTKLTRFLEEQQQMNQFQPQDLVNQLVQLHTLLTNLNQLVPLYKELDEHKTLAQLAQNEAMIVDQFRRLIRNATTLTLYKIDEFFNVLADIKENKEALKAIHKHAIDPNVTQGVQLFWEKDRGQKVKFDDKFNIYQEPQRQIQEKTHNNIHRSVWFRQDWKALGNDANYICVNGCLDWDLYRCPNKIKIFPNCKLKEQITDSELDDKKREINKKDFTLTVQMPPDIFIQHPETGDEDEEGAEEGNKSKYEVEVVWWDEDKGQYTNTEISQRKRTREIISFKTVMNAVHAIVVKRNIDFPFRNFFVRNVGDAIYLDLQTKRIDLQFKIEVVKGAAQIQLLNNVDDLLGNICGKQQSPVELFMKLQSIGINLLPTPEDALRNGCTSKDTAVNQFAQDVVSMLSVACSFKSTQFCHVPECGSDKIILKIRDNEDCVVYYDEDERRDYRQVCVYQNMLGVLDTNHLDVNLNLNLKEPYKNHYDLQKFVLEVQGEEMAKRIQGLSEELFDERNHKWDTNGDDKDMMMVVCLRNTLKALRIFEMTLTEDQYIEPDFEYEDLRLPEEQMEDVKDEENPEGTLEENPENI